VGTHHRCKKEKVNVTFFTSIFLIPHQDTLSGSSSLPAGAAKRYACDATWNNPAGNVMKLLKKMVPGQEL
jgi:beta-N-acetylglucosaminidase